MSEKEIEREVPFKCCINCIFNNKVDYKTGYWCGFINQHIDIDENSSSCQFMIFDISFQRWASKFRNFTYLKTSINEF